MNKKNPFLKQPRDYYVQIRILNKDGWQDVNIAIRAIDFTTATIIAREMGYTLTRDLVDHNKQAREYIKLYSTR